MNQSGTYNSIMEERSILTSAWEILKHHVGIERKAQEEERTIQEWQDLTQEVGKLYEAGASDPQKIFAQRIAMGIMDYYTELMKGVTLQ